MELPSRPPISDSRLIIALTSVLWLAGCGSGGPKPIPPPGAPHPTRVQSGTIAWPSWAKDNPQQGVDHAAAYACWDDRVVFVIWTDFDTSAGGTSGPTIDGVYRASLTAESGTQVDCECQTTDGNSGTVTIRVDKVLISDVPYDLKEGRVFLVSTRDDAPKVIQLSREVFDVAIEDAREDVTARLRELSVSDPEVKAFLKRGSEEVDFNTLRTVSGQPAL